MHVWLRHHYVIDMHYYEYVSIYSYLSVFFSLRWYQHHETYTLQVALRKQPLSSTIEVAPRDVEGEPIFTAFEVADSYMDVHSIYT